jgi:hypothetical protein
LTSVKPSSFNWLDHLVQQAYGVMCLWCGGTHTGGFCHLRSPVLVWPSGSSVLQFCKTKANAILAVCVMQSVCVMQFYL